MKKILAPLLLMLVVALIASSTAHAQLGVGTPTPTSTLDVRGSAAMAYADTGGSTSYTLTDADRTLRRYGNCATIYIPDASTCQGRLYTIVNSAGTNTSVALSVANGIIFEDANSVVINSLDATGANSRISIQSDGSNWIVIGR